MCCFSRKWIKSLMYKLVSSLNFAASDNQLFTEGRWFTRGTLVSSAIKTDHHDMTLDVECGVQHETNNSFFLLN